MVLDLCVELAFCTINTDRLSIVMTCTRQQSSLMVGGSISGYETEAAIKRLCCGMVGVLCPRGRTRDPGSGTEVLVWRSIHRPPGIANQEQ